MIVCNSVNKIEIADQGLAAIEFPQALRGDLGCLGSMLGGAGSFDHALCTGVFDIVVTHCPTESDQNQPERTEPFSGHFSSKVIKSR